MAEYKINTSGCDFRKVIGFYSRILTYWILVSYTLICCIQNANSSETKSVSALDITKRINLESDIKSSSNNESADKFSSYELYVKNMESEEEPLKKKDISDKPNDDRQATKNNDEEHENEAPGAIADKHEKSQAPMKNDPIATKPEPKKQKGSEKRKENVTENSAHFPQIQFPLGKPGQIIFPVLITLYLFLCLTIVCDCFLVPCIQAISTKVDLSLDIAGATLMAGASSSPEFFINMLATFLTNTDVGVGTVLGTSLYILFIVPALCILFSSSKLMRVDYWPVTRDALIFLVSIVLLVITLADGRVYWYEAASFIVVYGLYLLVLRFNSEIRYYIEMVAVIIHRRRYANQMDDPVWPLLHRPGRPTVSMSVEDVFYVLEDHAPEFYTMGQWPNSCGLVTKLQWLLIWPIITIMRMTIPTFWNSRFQRMTLITFIMCVAWIGILCYCTAWMITIIGIEISVPDSVMGLTLLAAGMSIPETISGVIVSNQGYATMALCNALGSNSFTILMCLGSPWLIKTLFFVKSEDLMSRHIVITSQGMEDSACVVLTALLVVFVIFIYNKFRFKSKVALLFVLLYIIFIGISIYFELKSFWKLQPFKK